MNDEPPPELETTAQVAVRIHPDGRLEIRAEILGEVSKPRPVSTPIRAAAVAAGIVETALRQAGSGLKAGQLDAFVVTVQTRPRLLTLEELAAKLRNPSAAI
jgi:hypothetical protein